MMAPPQPEMMPLLLEAIGARGYLGRNDIEAAASRLRIPSSRVYGFYTQFEEFPRRAHRALVHVCTGPACALRGSQEVLASLRDGVPEDVEVLAHPGLGCWHGSPAVCLEPSGSEAVLMEIRSQEDIHKAIGCLEKEGYVAAGTCNDALPPAVEAPPGNELPPWWASAGKGSLPGEWGPDLMRWVGDHPAEALQRIKEACQPGMGGRVYAAAFEENATGGAAPPVLVCDMVGASAENGLSGAAASLHPRAVVAGAALAAAAFNTEEIIFYMPWMGDQPHEYVEKAMKELIPGDGARSSIFRGPLHVPGTLDIGRSAVMRGSMLWRAASEHTWHGARLGDRSLAILPAEAAVRLPWIMGKSGKAVKKWAGSRLVSLTGHVRHPRLLAVPPRMSLREALSDLEPESGRGELKAVQAFGVEAGPVPYHDVDGLDIGASAQLLLLDNSTCMVRWAYYLSRRAQGACCGGCAPGRTVPAAAEQIILAVLQGRAGQPELHKLQDLLSSAGDLALCPRLGEMLRPVYSCLNNFEDEFSAHAVDGVCKAGSCALPEKAGA